ncbi:MAG: hypothetical protein ABSH50_00200 [Bryobacteraceae bacterium]|jgi:hypothetical protein
MIARVLAITAWTSFSLAAVCQEAGLSSQQWEEDIDFFARELPQRHANAFHHLTKEQFAAAVADLKRRLPRMNHDEIYVALDSIANAIGDAHTYIEFPPDRANLPVDLLKFGDDYRVVAVAPGLEEALGTRVVRIGDMDIAKVRELARAITPATETAALADARIAGFLTMGLTLHGLGVLPDRNAAAYTFRDDHGREFAVRVGARDSPIDWVSVVKEPPLYRQHRGEDFWYVYLPGSHTEYCNFRAYPRLYQNAPALLQELSEKDADKLVIDLRQNGGGDFRVGLKQLIERIQSLSKINQKGHLFVLIGVNTFSAAMSNAAMFRERTAAILVGEPIGERPDSYQEAREMRLPNSHLLVRYSTQYYKFAESVDNIIRPDEEVATTWEDYKAGRDPVLEWVLKYR